MDNLFTDEDTFSNRRGLYWRMPRILWREHVINESFKERDNKKEIDSYSPKENKFLEHIMWRNGLKTLELIEYTNGKRSRRKQRVNYLSNLAEWMARQEKRGVVNGEKLLRVTKTGRCDAPWYFTFWKNMAQKNEIYIY